MCAHAAFAQAPIAHVVANIHPTVVAPGTVFELQITIELPEGWIAYDVEQEPDSVPPTRIYLEDSATFAPVDAFHGPVALQRPDPAVNHRLVRYFDRSPTFRRGMLVAPDAPPGPAPISGRLDFQVRCERTGRSYVIRKYPFRLEATIGTPPLPAARTERNPTAAGGGNAEPQILRPAPGSKPMVTAEQETESQSPVRSATGAPVVPTRAGSAAVPSPTPDAMPQPGVVPAADSSNETAAPLRTPIAEPEGRALVAAPGAVSPVVSRYDDLLYGEFGLDRYAWLIGGVWWLAALGGFVGVAVGGLELRREPRDRRGVVRLLACLATVIAIAAGLYFVSGSALRWGLPLGVLAVTIAVRRIGPRSSAPSRCPRPLSAFWLTTCLTLSSLAADQAGLLAAAGAAGAALGFCTVLALVDPSWSRELLPVWKHPDWARR